MPPDGPEGFDDADLPGLDAGHVSPVKPVVPKESAEVPTGAPEAHGEPAGTDWSDAELDEWFENDFGGARTADELILRGFGKRTKDNPDLHFGLSAYDDLGHGASMGSKEREPWRFLSHEAKVRFRRGWEITQATTDSVVGELAPYDAMQTLVDASHTRTPPRSVPRWLVVGGGIGVLGLVLVVGFVLTRGDRGQDATALPTEAPVESAAPPGSDATIDDTVAPAVAPDTAAPSAVPFPTRWSYTATKTADIVPAPGFMTPTPIGTALPWGFSVTEICGSDTCTHTTAILPLIPDALVGEVPEAAWAIDGAVWSLDVTYQTVQSRYGDGTVCVIANHEIFELTVTQEVADGRSIPVTFEGTWIQATSLDLEASTGDTATYCGESWEVVDEWSLVGVAAH